MIKCKYCNGISMYLKFNKSQMLGLYCSDCGKWVKWVGNTERAFMMKIYVVVEEGINTTHIKTDKASESSESARNLLEDIKQPCRNCGGFESMGLVTKGVHVGLYCLECNKWHYWLSKDEKEVAKRFKLM